MREAAEHRRRDRPVRGRHGGHRGRSARRQLLARRRVSPEPAPRRADGQILCRIGRRTSPARACTTATDYANAVTAAGGTFAVQPAFPGIVNAFRKNAASRARALAGRQDALHGAAEPDGLLSARRPEREPQPRAQLPVHPRLPARHLEAGGARPDRRVDLSPLARLLERACPTRSRTSVAGRRRAPDPGARRRSPDGDHALLPGRLPGATNLLGPARRRTWRRRRRRPRSR